MQSNMNDIKKDIVSLKNDLNDFRERIVAVETKVAVLSNRLDQNDIKKIYEKEK